MTVTFCGHRTIDRPTEVKSWLEEVVRSLILQGSNKFLLGGYGAFDLTAAHVVHELKAEFPCVESTLVLAYLSTDTDPHLYDNCIRHWKTSRPGMPSPDETVGSSKTPMLWWRMCSTVGAEPQPHCPMLSAKERPSLPIPTYSMVNDLFENFALFPFGTDTPA